MNRLPEPELMNDPAQAHAYAHADFAEPHQRFVSLFTEEFPTLELCGRVLDLGCGAADVTLRFARAFPDCVIDAVDGAEQMLDHAHALIAHAGMQARINLLHRCLPTIQLPSHPYDAIISNSLLHHLHDPNVLWNTIKTHARAGTAIFVLDLLRPASVEQAHALVEQYAQAEPAILKRDFFNSLLAAFRADEIGAQLMQCGLPQLRIRAISDRHVLISGTVQTPA
jgi:trans-aconitate methyltransferase